MCTYTYNPIELLLLREDHTMTLCRHQVVAAANKTHIAHTTQSIQT